MNAKSSVSVADYMADHLVQYEKTAKLFCVFCRERTDLEKVTHQEIVTEWNDLNGGRIGPLPSLLSKSTWEGIANLMAGEYRDENIIVMHLHLGTQKDEGTGKTNVKNAMHLAHQQAQYNGKKTVRLLCLSMAVYVCLCMCMSVFVCLSMFMSLSLYVYGYMTVSFYVCI